MAQTFTPSTVTSGAAAQIDYPMIKGIGLPGLLADISQSRILSGSNETNAIIPYGIPVKRNAGGTLPNSFEPITGAGAMLGLLVRTNTHEKVGYPAVNELPDYEEGVPPLKEGNVMTQGAIYIACMEAVPADSAALRFHKSGAFAGQWGVTAEAGETIALAAGGWVIRKAGSASQLAILEINTPAALSFTADV
jgi:hypothetical protein